MKYQRKDQTKRSLLIANEDIFNIMSIELNKEEEIKEYRDIFDRSISELRVLQNYPVHVDFELNFICNLKCSFCIHSYSGDKLSEWGDKSQKLSFEKFKSIIDDGVEKGLKSIGFNGTNEPLTVPNIIDFINYAKSKGILDIMFNTNGNLLDRKISEELIQSGLTRIMISVDAFSNDVYKTERIGGDFDKLKNNILTFIKLRDEYGKRLPLIRLSYLVHSRNIQELDDFIDYWKDKVDFFAIQNMRDPFLYDKAKSIAMRNHFDVKDNDIQDFFVCPQPYVRILIRNNGDVIPCCSFYGMKIVIGNIYKNSISEIWNGEKMKVLREIVNDEKRQYEACRKCRKGSVECINMNTSSDKLVK